VTTTLGVESHASHSQQRLVVQPHPAARKNQTKTKGALIRELLCADDVALVAHSEMNLQNLCNCFAKACTDFSITTNFKKAVVTLLKTPNLYAFSPVAH